MLDNKPVSAEIVLAQSSELVSIATELFREYATAIGVDLEYQGFSAELAALPSPYESPHGALLIAQVDGSAAGCVAMKRLDVYTAEMKRLYVRPDFRNLGLAKRLIDAIILATRRAGYRELRLDTLPSMASAQALYRKVGFVEIAPYNTTHLPGTRFYALGLDVS